MRRVIQGPAIAAVLLAAAVAAHVEASASEPTQPSSAPRAETPNPWGQARGWSVGFQFLSDFIGAEDPQPGSSTDAVFVEEQGGGGVLHLGYAFTPTFALRFAVAGARHETTKEDVEIDHLSATVEAVFRFLHGERAQPYLFGGLGGATLEFNSDVFDSKTSGGVAVLGAGFQYHLTRHLSLDLAGRLDLINWDKVEVSAELPGGETIRLEDPVDESGSAGKILLGVAWNF
jgi:opacity protein-like surface antigen